MPVPIALIAAMAENRVIGADNKLLWHIPADFRHFKATTMGKPVIMGRKTYDSIGKPLPGRTNIVITRNAAWTAEGVKTATTLEQAIETAQAENPPEIMIIGGAQVYAAALQFATRVYLTLIHRVYNGDALFPLLSPDEWTETARTNNDSDPAFDFITYQRKSAV
ncbi:MAG: dihydrofolate reductase [Rhodospirillales bacterium]|nr:dihydrofolate reductase [Alphaproteobacteria bacterium]MCB9986875.1 dihydrofolate reductase [Rhodospirillales bacterium]USO08347.1 MAG: dihydrofolate reductase [Rhodospirillales bacterium]